LKDKLDPLPQESGLSSDDFVLCIQTKFQRDQFRMLGSKFLSIDATHNTCQYKGLQFYTLVVRDLWGHGMLCGAFTLWGHLLISTLQVFLLCPCYCQVAQRQQYSSFSKFQLCMIKTTNWKICLPTQSDIMSSVHYVFFLLAHVESAKTAHFQTACLEDIITLLYPILCSYNKLA
jgi:hypothetical protein